MIKMIKLTKSYRVGKMETLILRGIDLNIKMGEFVSICGPSGSGKTTLLNIMGCLDSFDQGTFLMFDQMVQEMKESERTKLRANHIGFVFQDYYLIDHLTVEENIKAAELLGDPNHQLEIDHLLSEVGMSKHKHKYPQDLSGGEKQRVAIARALINLPDLILADEAIQSYEAVISKDGKISITEETLFKNPILSRQLIRLLVDKITVGNENIKVEILENNQGESE